MRPGTGETRGGHDRWLVSYADLVTLLLALFAALYAASTIDAQKLGSLSSSLQEAFDTPASAPPPAPTAIVPPVTVVPRVPEPAPAVPADDLEKRLARDLADAIERERIQLHRDERGLVLSLPEEAAFGIGKADVTAEAEVLIGRIARTVADTPNAVRIEGHTDNVPIRTSRYQSNWELSTARASAVVEFLITTTGLAPERLSAAGYGEFHPKVANDTPENRARNRRIDIVILDRAAR